MLVCEFILGEGLILPEHFVFVQRLVDQFVLRFKSGFVFKFVRLVGELVFQFVRFQFVVHSVSGVWFFRCAVQWLI